MSSLVMLVQVGVVEVVAVTAVGGVTSSSMAVVVDIHFCYVWVVLRRDFKSSG